MFSRIYPGSVKDVSALIGMVAFLEQLQLRQMHFVMDKGFYSTKGVGVLLEKYIKPELFTVQQHQPLSPGQLLYFN